MVKKTVQEQTEAVARRLRESLEVGQKKMASKTIGEAALRIARRGEPISFERLIEVLGDTKISLDDVSEAWRPVAIGVLTAAMKSSAERPS